MAGKKTSYEHPHMTKNLLNHDEARIQTTGYCLCIDGGCNTTLTYRALLPLKTDTRRFLSATFSRA